MRLTARSRGRITFDATQHEARLIGAAISHYAEQLSMIATSFADGGRPDFEGTVVGLIDSAERLTAIAKELAPLVGITKADPR